MILHIFRNDKKFVNTIISNFEKQNYKRKNIFYIETKEKKLDYIKNIKNIFLIKPNELVKNNFIKKLNNFSLIVLHYFTKHKAIMLSKADIKVPVVWCVWGGDLYQSHPKLNEQLFLSKTNKLRNKQSKNTKEWIKYILTKFGIIKNKYHFQQKAIDKITHIAPIIENEFNIIKRYYNAPHLKYINFIYGEMQDGLNVNPKNVIKNKNIMIGNSATFTSNHIEIIDILGKINIENRKIIVPLSYGDKKYANYIANYGNKKLRNNFEPLLKFIEKKEYNKLMSSFGYLIMNHKRQQGMYIVYVGLQIGYKIFFNKNNPTYSFLKSLGYEIFTIDEIIEKKEKAFFPLSVKQIEKNRAILKKNKGKSVVDALYKKLLNLSEKKI